MKSSSVLCLALALAAGLAAPAHAQWKWKDASGRVTVSDMPPPREIADKDILQRPSDGQRRAAPAAPAAAASAAAAPGAARVDPELEARRKKLESEHAAQKKADEDKLAAARAENCQRAQAQMRSLDSGMRIARVNDKGEREILDDRQVAEEKQRARNAIASDCR